MLKNNKETMSALNCRIPEILPEWCEGCRDKPICDHHKQITIFDLLSEVRK